MTTDITAAEYCSKHSKFEIYEEMIRYKNLSDILSKRIEELEIDIDELYIQLEDKEYD